MTDKQIIIDGCDVSGCSLYEDNPKYRMWGTCDCMRSMVDQSGYDELAGAECKGYNCYYKQLKRKEQECDELKGKLKYIRDENVHLKVSATDEQMDFLALNNYISTLEFQIDQLKAEKEKMSKGYSNLTEIVSPYMDDFTGYNEELGGFDIVLCVKELLQQLDQLKSENEKLKQTLAEIKPTLEFYANSKMGEEQPDRTYKIILNGSYITVYDPKPARQALQKISECEVKNVNS